MTDNQFNELFGLLTKAVNKLNEHDAKFEEIVSKQNEHDAKFEIITSSLNDFRQETKTNFEKVSKEVGSQQRKISYLANQFLEIKAENEDLKERVAALEELNAA